MTPTFGRGRLTAFTDSAGGTEFSYNSLGQLLRETRTNSGMAALATVYGYNSANADLDSITYPSGLVVSYGRDSNGRIATILADNVPLIGTISYMPFGPAEDYDMIAGGAVLLHVDWTFNEWYLPTLIQAGTVMDYQYKYYADGSVWQISGVPTTTVNQEVTDSYQVSGTNQLDFSVTDTNPPVQYGYDANGNTISDGSRTFTYDRHNRLIRISQGTETLAEYAYDFQGRRVKKTVGGMTTCYVYDAGNNLIAEIAGDGTPLRDYIYLGSEPVAMKVYGTKAGIYYFINDHLGTPQKIVDSIGALVWEAAYLPFGQAQVLVATITNNLRFPGQYFDEETGLHYNWHRYYDPVTGRYLTPDPIGLAGGINLYSYVSNNPINFIDPFGLWQINAELTLAGVTVEQNIFDSDGGFFPKGLDPKFEISPELFGLGGELQLDPCEDVHTYFSPYFPSKHLSFGFSRDGYLNEISIGAGFGSPVGVSATIPDGIGVVGENIAKAASPIARKIAETISGFIER